MGRYGVKFRILPKRYIGISESFTITEAFAECYEALLVLEVSLIVTVLWFGEVKLGC